MLCRPSVVGGLAVSAVFGFRDYTARAVGHHCPFGLLARLWA